MNEFELCDKNVKIMVQGSGWLTNFLYNPIIEKKHISLTGIVRSIQIDTHTLTSLGEKKTVQLVQVSDYIKR